MPRISRPVFPGLPHHVVQRGNRREDVFFSDSDRLAYLWWLGEYCTRHDVALLAYCLMTNHVHAVVVPHTEDALERVFRPLHTRYALRVNRARDWKGHVWQGRYFSAPLDDAYLVTAIRYVERNPVRACMVARAEHYPWSSAAAHCGLRTDALLKGEDRWLAEMKTSRDWSRWLAGDEPPLELAVLRENTAKRFPCGSDSFVSRLESVSGRQLRPRPRGRPVKARG